MKNTKTHTKTGRIYKNMAACAAGEKTTTDVVKWAKNEGCEAFRANGNVNADEFRDWLRANKDRAPKGSSLKDQKLAEEVRKLRIRNDKDEGHLIDSAKNDQFLLAASKGFQAILWQKLLNELPASAANQDAPAIRILAENVYNRVMVEIKKLLKTPDLRAILEKNPPANEPS